VAEGQALRDMPCRKGGGGWSSTAEAERRSSSSIWQRPPEIADKTLGEKGVENQRLSWKRDQKKIGGEDIRARCLLNLSVRGIDKENLW